MWNGRRKEYSASLYVSVHGPDKRDIQKEDMEEYYPKLFTCHPQHSSQSSLFFFMSMFFPSKIFFCFSFLIENKIKEMKMDIKGMGCSLAWTRRMKLESKRTTHYCILSSGTRNLMHSPHTHTNLFPFSFLIKNHIIFCFSLCFSFYSFGC